jgi:4-hydroxybenzoate polyprenyltransferase
MKYLKLIRIQNLLLLAFMQVLFRYTFLKTATFTTLTPTKNFLALSHFQFGLLVLATVCIAAAGYIINAILNQDIDENPKSCIIGIHISESKAYNLYVAFNLIGVGIGFYLSNVIQKPSFSSLFIFVAAIFVFIISFMLELVKDVEKKEIDYASGINTLPVLLGTKKTMKIIFILSFLPALAVVYYINKNLANYDYVLYYSLLFIIAPLLFFMIKSWSSKTQKEYNNLKKILKIILFFGILSIIIITYTIPNA